MSNYTTGWGLHIGIGSRAKRPSIPIASPSSWMRMAAPSGRYTPWRTSPKSTRGPTTRRKPERHTGVPWTAKRDLNGLSGSTTRSRSLSSLLASTNQTRPPCTTSEGKSSGASVRVRCTPTGTSRSRARPTSRQRRRSTTVAPSTPTLRCTSLTSTSGSHWSTARQKDIPACRGPRNET